MNPDQVFTDEMTLAEARELLRTLIDEGERCPCCTQLAKVYERKINSTMARALITLYKHGGDSDFQHCPSLPGDTHEISQFAWWGLVTDKDTRREDGGRAGFWKLTAAGVSFVTGETAVLRLARVYDHRCLGLTGDYTTIADSLGDKFSYRELLGNRWTEPAPSTKAPEPEALFETPTKAATPNQYATT